MSVTPLPTRYFTTPAILHLSILPTEKCNFRCLYCNQSFLAGAMRPETVEGIKQLLLNRKQDLKQLIVSWFGGEPLLGYSTIIEIMEFISAKIGTNDGPSLKSGMTTNGYLLTPDRLRKLAALGVNEFQVTFDGDENEHNALRLAVNGLPTFDIILKNLVDARKVDEDFKIIIRLHANLNNADSMRRLIERLGHAFSDDPRFEVYVRRLANGIGPNHASLPTLPTGSDVVEKLTNSARGFGLGVHANGYWHEGVCAASALNSFAIRPDGRISKCLLVLEDESNIVGRLNSDGTMSLDAERLKWWSRGIFSDSSEDKGCPASPLVEKARRDRGLDLTIGCVP